jgi:hypothetical protein
MWGVSGPFPLGVAMVVAVVTLIVFCAKATEILKNAKNTNPGCFLYDNLIYNYIF